MADDEVGYKKPPRHTRFQPGRSGNPKGRPKASKNFKTVFERELNHRIAIAENGRSKKVSKRDAIAKRLVNGAVNGDLKAAQVVLTQDRIYRQEDPATGPSLEIFDKPGHQLVLEHFVERIRQTKPLEARGTENGMSAERAEENPAPTSAQTSQESIEDGE